MKSLDNELGRRTVLRLGGVAATAATATALTGCADQLTEDDSADGDASPAPDGSPGAGGEGRAVRIGYVSPQTGPLAPFGEADTFVVEAMTAYFADNPLVIGGTSHPVEIVVKDTQSDSARAADVANELILEDEVDFVLVSSTPDTTNPVADTCEANGMPCISTVAPWQPAFFGRGGDPETPFQWTYHFFWGLEDVQAVYLDMWSQVETNQVAGALWPNDPDGQAWGSSEPTGFPAVVGEQGYETVDPGFYENGTQDFTAQISAFRDAGAEILLGVPIPPDFTTFWNQAQQQGFTPRIATIGKALLFPSAIDALGESGQNLGTEVWWSPNHPFASSLTGETAEELAAAYTEETGQPWTQPIGFVHALFEVAAAALSAADSPDDREGVAGALAELQVDTVVGPLDWTSGPVPNVAKTPLTGGQWRQTDGEWDLVIVSNSEAPDIPTGGSVEPLA
jgi:branched-chain amino acid transport system substrate-binding protein